MTETVAVCWIEPDEAVTVTVDVVGVGVGVGVEEPPPQAVTRPRLAQAVISRSHDGLAPASYQADQGKPERERADRPL